MTILFFFSSGGKLDSGLMFSEGKVVSPKVAFLRGRSSWLYKAEGKEVRVTPDHRLVVLYPFLILWELSMQ